MSQLTTENAEALHMLLESLEQLGALRKTVFNEVLNRLHPGGVETTEDVADVLEETRLKGGLNSEIVSRCLIALRDTGAGTYGPMPWAGELIHDLVQRTKT